VYLCFRGMLFHLHVVHLGLSLHYFNKEKTQCQYVFSSLDKKWKSDFSLISRYMINLFPCLLGLLLIDLFHVVDMKFVVGVCVSLEIDILLYGLLCRDRISLLSIKPEQK
jgi:hypothetical protein